MREWIVTCEERRRERSRSGLDRASRCNGHPPEIAPECGEAAAGEEADEARRVQSRPQRRPLLVIDGDSFAHRSYHALPKTILRRGRKPAGAILGFANLLLRLYREEQPRAVLVAWDTLEVPTYRHEKFPAYQSGREFDDALA